MRVVLWYLVPTHLSTLGFKHLTDATPPEFEVEMVCIRPLSKLQMTCDEKQSCKPKLRAAVIKCDKPVGIALTNSVHYLLLKSLLSLDINLVVGEKKKKKKKSGDKDKQPKLKMDIGFSMQRPPNQNSKSCKIFDISFRPGWLVRRLFCTWAHGSWAQRLQLQTATWVFQAHIPQLELEQGQVCSDFDIFNESKLLAHPTEERKAIHVRSGTWGNCAPTLYFMVLITHWLHLVQCSYWWEVLASTLLQQRYQVLATSYQVPIWNQLAYFCITTAYCLLSWLVLPCLPRYLVLKVRLSNTSVDSALADSLLATVNKLASASWQLPQSPPP